jgi:hypothetical protein
MLQGKETTMPLGKHERTESGQFRRERSDSLAKNLAKDYPEFKAVPGNTKLGTLKDRFDATSINEVRKALRDRNK